MTVEALFQISEPGASSAKEACKGRVVGIDLGTTNSLVATVQAGAPGCLVDEKSKSTMLPSVVHYAADGGIVVGAEARSELALRFPRDTLSSVKRFMGRGPKDAEAQRRLTPYELAPGRESDPIVRFRVAGGRDITPIEASAEILRVLRARAEEALGGPLEGAVITVPAYFDDAQRQATRDAGRLAGLEVMRLLNEPTAAALAYGLDKKVQGTFAVYDLGGGTFDISLLGLEDGVFEVKSTGGDAALGGDDFDRAIAASFLAELGWPADAGGDRRLSRRVLDAARAVKEALTEAESATVTLPSATGPDRELVLARSAMEALVKPVLERTGPSVRRALKDAGLKPPELDGVILVGGATRMPLVRRYVKELFGREALSDLDPDEVVALGAAIQAEILGGGSAHDNVVLLDVVPLSLGLEMMGGVVEKLIHRNSTIPCGANQTFTTYADNQTGWDLHVVQGEREMVTEGRSLARFKLTGIPPMPAGMARLEVTFLVDADGILRVSAKEETTGKEASIDVKPSYGLTDEEVERMLLDSFAHADEDVKARLLAEQRVEAERILHALDVAVAADAALLTEEDRTAIDGARATLVSARTGSDAAVIRRAVEGLDAASKSFAARRMNTAFERGLAGKTVSDVETKVAATEPTDDLATRLAHAGHGHR